MISYFYFLFFLFCLGGGGARKDNRALIFHKQQLSFFDCNHIKTRRSKSEEKNGVLWTNKLESTDRNYFFKRFI